MSSRMSPKHNLVLALLIAAAAWGVMRWWGQPGLDERLAERVGLRERPGEVLADIMGVQALHSDRLLELAGAQALGIGWTADGRPALKLFLAPGSPPVALDRVDGFPLIIEEAGPFVALAPQEAPSAREDRRPATSGRSAAPVSLALPIALPDAWQDATASGPGIVAAEAGEMLPTSRFDRPVPMGISTGHTRSTAGTIGAVVTDGVNRYALSNWHVYVPGGEGRIGDVLLQPGPVDGGAAPADEIGTLAAFEPVVLSPFADNRIDAALARTDDVMPRTPADGYGSPTSRTLRARPGLEVQKYGRTTGLTRGRIETINTSINVSYGSAGSQVARFNGQIIICCNFSAGGDSGSLIVAHDLDGEGEAGPNDRRPVALLFAGDRTRTIANPIDLVLERFDVSIVSDDRD